MGSNLALHQFSSRLPSVTVNLTLSLFHWFLHAGLERETDDALAPVPLWKVGGASVGIGPIAINLRWQA
jgi:hypothetical protein